MPKTNRRYTEEFRRNAVDLLISSGRPLKEVADELGVTANSLRLWRNRAIGAQSEGLAVAESPDGLAEVKRLRRENDYLRRQRDILKKAMSILNEDPQLGMQ